MFTRRRKLAYEGLHPEMRNGRNQHTARVSQIDKPTSAKSFAADTAEKTGQFIETVSRDAARGLKISEQALAALRGFKPASCGFEIVVTPPVFREAFRFWCCCVPLAI
jgi:hypothetical protein